MGKGPLASALKRHHPELAERLLPLVLHNSRAPRPGEVDGVDYHFVPRAEIQRLVSSDLEDIERRATSAIAELRFAHGYDHVIANHDGEDSENWDAFYYPVGDAFTTLASFAALLAGESPDRVETWEPGLLRTPT